MTDLARRLGRNSFWKLLGDGSRVLLALFLILIARRYGPEAFGRLMLFYTISLFLGMLIDLGLNVLVTRQVAAEKGDSVAVTRAFLSLKLVTLPLWLLAPAVFALIERSASKSDLALFSVLALAHAARNVLEFFGAVFTGLELIQYESAFKVLAHLVMFALGGAAAFWGLPVLAIAGSMAAGYGFAALFSAIWCHRLIGLFPLTMPGAPFAANYRETLPLIMIPAGLSVIARSGTVLLGYFGGTAFDIGWFTAAEKVVSALAIIPAIASAAAYPVFSDLHRNDQSSFFSARIRMQRGLLILGAVTAAVIVAGSGLFIDSAFGSKFAGARPSLAILAAGMVFSFPSAALLQILIASNRSNEAAVSVLAAGAANVTLSLVLMPLWGAAGAACASVAGQAVLYAAALMACGRAPSAALNEA